MKGHISFTLMAERYTRTGIAKTVTVQSRDNQLWSMATMEVISSCIAPPQLDQTLVKLSLANLDLFFFFSFFFS